MSPRKFTIDVNPTLPKNLARLKDLASDLWYSWDRPTRSLFVRLDKKLWEVTNHNPNAMIKRIDQKQLDKAAEDPVFLGDLARCLPAFDNYHNRDIHEFTPQLGKNDMVAYFCAEFGLHESLPIYSGGLGILAGDHCKTASDLGLPFVAVGLLYRQGYFTQTIDSKGNQLVSNFDSDFEDLPISPVNNKDGSELIISIPYPGRTVSAKVWQANIGHITLYLLDANIPTNNEKDRNITHQLYGGDRSMRLEQEILLGMGGARALQALNIKPTAWHINEGHAAFLIIERVRALIVQNPELDFATALEAVASNTIFTTHTPVPAGHDKFDVGNIREYFNTFCSDLKCSIDELVGLGLIAGEHEFNMTTLAIRGTRLHNGVSRIHGKVSAEICSHHWPQISWEDNPMSYVTNGVHVPTFLNERWYEAFNQVLGAGWDLRLTDNKMWQGIMDIPDHQFWSIRQLIKMEMLWLVGAKLTMQHRRNQGSEAHLARMLKYLSPENPNVLTIGFARRFATYKRANLLFQDLKLLKEIVSNKEKPLVFIFAGKAHPADKPGQDMIRRIAEVAAMPEFIGHIILIEGYDLHLSRRLVSGVDVWLNNPIYPMEASGTSGMKAAINGAINLSVVDGWWGEALEEEKGYENGWGIKPVNTLGDIVDPARDAEESRELYEILQDKVVPLYYEKGKMGYSPGWVGVAKRSIATIAPNFTSARMLRDYINNFYKKASSQGKLYFDDNLKNAKEISQWKNKVKNAWHKINIRRIDEPVLRMAFGNKLSVKVAVYLDGLSPEDVCVELLMNRLQHDSSNTIRSHILNFSKKEENGESTFETTFAPSVCGKLEYRIRIFPSHKLLAHKFEMGMMLWV